MKSIQNIILKGVFTIALLSFSLNSWLQEQPCVYFDGVDDYVETNHEGINAIWYDYTFEATINGRGEEQGDDPTIFSNRWSHIKGNTVYLKENGDEARVLCFSHGGDEYFIPGNGSYEGTLLDGKCHHIAIVKSGNDIIFYIDGAHIGTLSNPYYYCECLNGWNSVWIGRDHHYDNPFKGIISQVRIWDSARNAYDIAENMDVSLAGTESGLVSYWELNEGTGQGILEKASEIWSGHLGDSIVSDTFDPIWTEENYCGSEQHVNVADNIAAPALLVYPNPAVNTIWIESSAELIGETYNIYNNMGKLVAQGKISNSYNQLDISDLATGYYELSLQSSEAVLRSRFVKQ